MTLPSFKNFLRCLLLLGTLVSSTQLVLASQTLTIKGSSTDAGDVIVFDDDTNIALTVNDTGIVVTLPDVDVRVRCLGVPTAEGYCLISANEPGAGSGSGVDTDGDGVPDNKPDSCPGTPANSYVNSSGCTATQAGGGGGTAPSDVDNDGVADSADNCPNNANLSQADNDGDGVGNVCDSTPNGSTPDDGTDGGGTSGYCTNSKYPALTVCTSSRNFDDYWESKGEATYTIPQGKILVLPFTARASSTDSSALAFTTNEPFSNSHYWEVWVSTRPGGTRLSSNCGTAGGEARGNFTITQRQSEAYCNIGTAGGTYYLNFMVSNSSGFYSNDYIFDVGRAAR